MLCLLSYNGVVRLAPRREYFVTRGGRVAPTGAVLRLADSNCFLMVMSHSCDHYTHPQLLSKYLIAFFNIVISSLAKPNNLLHFEQINPRIFLVL